VNRSKRPALEYAKDVKIVDLSKNLSVVGQYVHEMRDVTVQQDRMRFVTNLERIGAISGYEISKELEYSETEAHTPFSVAKTRTLMVQPVVATIIRAGLPFLNGFLQVFDKADSAFITAYRQIGEDGAMESVIEYVSCPKLDNRPLIIADTMIATGTTIVDAYHKLMEYGHPSQVFVSSVIISTSAIAYIKRHIPTLTIYSAAIDDKLNDKFFIIPGLGDAGDIIYGEKYQRPIG
jgi:uracil phosphoribosyltransferase